MHATERARARLKEERRELATWSCADWRQGGRGRGEERGEERGERRERREIARVARRDGGKDENGPSHLHKLLKLLAQLLHRTKVTSKATWPEFKGHTLSCLRA